MKPRTSFIYIIICFLVSGVLFARNNPYRKLHSSFQALVDPNADPLLKAAHFQKPHVSSVRSDGTKEYGVIIHTEDAEALRAAGIRVMTELSGFVTALVTEADLVTLAGMDVVEKVNSPEILYIDNDVARGYTGVQDVHAGAVNNTSYKGEDVIVCIIDTGIDWEHGDFRDPDDDTQSRILYIWDQTLTAIAGENTPSETGCTYGVEYTNAHIEDEIDGSPTGYVREQDTNGHGSHVAGTAAGNGAAMANQKYEGMASEADILVVKAGNGSFSSTDIINGISYAQQKAAALGKPIVINMSLGGHDNAHDGTSEKAQAIDSFTSSGDGRLVCVSAGNDGDDSLHVVRTMTASGGTTDITFDVDSYGPLAGSNNDFFQFKVWFDGGTNVSATVYSPGDVYSHTQVYLSSGGVATNHGTIFIYNQTYENSIHVQVYDSNSSFPPVTGTWTLRLTNNTASSLTVHGWLYSNTIPIKELSPWDTDYTLSNTATSAIIVGSYASRWRWSNTTGSGYWYGTPDLSDNISAYSSIGPTRTGTEKPDITAPGQAIISSKSQSITVDPAFVVPGGEHRRSQGTSMSSPVVAGAVALILEANPNLSASEVAALIENNADTDSYTGSVWNSTWGHGKLNMFETMKKVMDSGASADREMLAYDEWGTDAYIFLGSASYQKIAVRFTPSISGYVSGALFHPSTTNLLTDSLRIEIWTDSGGDPGSLITGSTAGAFHQNDILKYSWNYLDLTGNNAMVTAATDYHLVLYPKNGGEQLTIRTDDNGGTGRSKAYNGTSWGTVSADLRLRPVIETGEGVYAQIQLFLEGCYSSGTMSTYLNSGGYLPLTSPYSDDARTVTSIPSTITDWVLVQLRSEIDGSAVASQSVLLRNDGYLVADNGETACINFDVADGDYFILVNHRNHINVISDETVSMSSAGTAIYDFTSGTDKYEGTEAADLGGGEYGFFAGDPNQTEVVNSGDYLVVKTLSGSTGYYVEDCNLTGVVNSADYLVIKPNSGMATHVP